MQIGNKAEGMARLKMTNGMLCEHPWGTKEDESHFRARAGADSVSVARNWTYRINMILIDVPATDRGLYCLLWRRSTRLRAWRKVEKGRTSGCGGCCVLNHQSLGDS